MSGGANRGTVTARSNEKLAVGPTPRREIIRQTPVVHGGRDVAELRALGMEALDILDFSASVNPFGPSPKVREALATVPLDQYPDRDTLALCETLAQCLGLTPEKILAGNGTSELIALVALAFIRAGDPILIVGPTYAEYARASVLVGGRVTTWRAKEDTGFAPEPAVIQRRLKKLAPRVVFLCNPNNPTGAALPAESIRQWARQHPRVLFVVDEAYLLFAREMDTLLDAAGNLLVLRSLTKDYGLAGLRLGYAVGAVEIIEALRRAQPPWSVNALAQAAGIAALEDRAHQERTLGLIQDAKEQLAAGLTQRGWRPLPSAAPFFLVRVGDGAAVRQRLLARGILVRDCASFGLPAHIRIAVRRPEENERLLGVLASIR